VSESNEFEAKSFDLSNDAPLRIGFGQYNYFKGSIKDVRLYRRALTKSEVIKMQTNR